MANERAAARKRDEKRMDDFPISRVPDDEEKFFCASVRVGIRTRDFVPRSLRLGNCFGLLLLGPLALNGHTRRAEGEE